MPSIDPNGKGTVQLTPALDRLPPQAYEAEQSVLGCMMMAGNGEVIDEAREILTPDSFFRRSTHGEIFAAACDLNDAGEECDVLSVGQLLEDRGLIDHCGGRPYLMACQAVVPFESKIGTFARQVREKHRLRQMIDLGGKLMGAAYEQLQSADELADTAIDQIASVRLGTADLDDPELADLATEYLAQVEAHGAADGHPLGVASGFPQLDYMTSGFQPSTLTLVAGRTSTGKTSLALRFGLNAAKDGYTVYFFSLEMGVNPVVQRVFSAEAKVDGRALNNSEYGEVPGAHDAWADVMLALGELKKFPSFKVNTSPGITLRDIRARVRRAQAKGKCDLVIVDYIHLLGPPGRTSDEVQRINGLAIGLKAIARDLNLPVIALSQINREPEKNRTSDHRPRLSDLKGSGGLEESADAVILIYRPDYYQKQGQAELILAKNRHGPTGSIPVKFVPHNTDFIPVLAGQNGE